MLVFFNVVKNIKWTLMCWLPSEACLLADVPINNAMVEKPLTPSGLDSLLGLSGL